MTFEEATPTSVPRSIRRRYYHHVNTTREYFLAIHATHHTTKLRYVVLQDIETQQYILVAFDVFQREWKPVVPPFGKELR